MSKTKTKYKNILFSLPGIIVSIKENTIGEPIYVLISIAINGNRYTVKKYIRQIGFKVKPNMRIIVDCIEKSGHKELSFRKVKQIKLDNELLELLKNF